MEGSSEPIVIRGKQQRTRAVLILESILSTYC